MRSFNGRSLGSPQIAALEQKKRRQIAEAKREAASAESGTPRSYDDDDESTYNWTVYSFIIILLAII